MKQKWGSAIVKEVKLRGWVEIDNILYPPSSSVIKDLNKNTSRKKRSLSYLKTGWIDDHRNIKNKETIKDPFILLVKQELGLNIWPEFFFSTERQYRIDYAIPISPNSVELKIAIEQEGGIWAKGNSGHSSGTGIKRDMDKNNILQSLGWRLIRRTPSEMITIETLELIKKLL